jgi:hypothetical protein
VENGLATEQQIDAARRIRGDGPPGPTLRRGRPWPCEDSGDDQRFDVHAECRAEDTTATIDSCGDAGTKLFDRSRDLVFAKKTPTFSTSQKIYVFVPLKLTPQPHADTLSADTSFASSLHDSSAALTSSDPFRREIHA